MPKYECLKCHRFFYGWAVMDKCSNCGGKLRKVETDDQGKKKEKGVKL